MQNKSQYKRTTAKKKIEIKTIKLSKVLKVKELKNKYQIIFF